MTHMAVGGIRPLTGTVLNMIPAASHESVVRIEWEDGSKEEFPVLAWATVVTWTSWEDPNTEAEDNTYEAAVEPLFLWDSALTTETSFRGLASYRDFTVLPD